MNDIISLIFLVSFNTSVYSFIVKEDKIFVILLKKYIQILK